MSLSLTWQQLPEYLLEPLMAEVISAAEAAMLWDLLLTETDEWADLPPILHPAAERLLLWEMDVDPTRH